MIMIIFVANNKDVLDKYVNGKISNIFGWIITTIMFVLSVVFFATL